MATSLNEIPSPPKSLKLPNYYPNLSKADSGFEDTQISRVKKYMENEHPRRNKNVAFDSANPVSLPFIIKNRNIRERSTTLLIFGRLDPVKPISFENYHASKSDVLTSNSNVYHIKASASKKSAASNNTGKMFVTDLWSEKHLKEIKTKSGILSQTEDIEKACRMGYDQKLKLFQEFFTKNFKDDHKDLVAKAINKSANQIQPSNHRRVGSCINLTQIEDDSSPDLRNSKYIKDGMFSFQDIKTSIVPTPPIEKKKTSSQRQVSLNNSIDELMENIEEDQVTKTNEPARKKFMESIAYKGQPRPFRRLKALTKDMNTPKLLPFAPNQPRLSKNTKELKTSFNSPDESSNKTHIQSDSMNVSVIPSTKEWHNAFDRIIHDCDQVISSSDSSPASFM